MFSQDALVALLVCFGAASATMIGALVVLGTKEISPRILAFGLAFAGGAMVYISMIEIFWKSHQSFLEVYSDQMAYNLATVAFFGGMISIALMDNWIPNPHNSLSAPADDPAGGRGELKRVGLLATAAITAHNVPEGMATFFATLDDPTVGLSLAFAIAVHNIPEGVSIAIPVFYATGSRKQAILASFISAIAEPIGAILGYVVLHSWLSPQVFGAVFGAIAGAMVFLAIDELLPVARKHAAGHDTVYGILVGMMTIAVSLSMFR